MQKEIASSSNGELEAIFLCACYMTLMPPAKDGAAAETATTPAVAVAAIAVMKRFMGDPLIKGE